MKINIIAISHHLNGISGVPFKKVLFSAGETMKIAILFETLNHCAVFDLATHSRGDIRLGANSFRGDCFEQPLRTAINAHRQPQE